MLTPPKSIMESSGPVGTDFHPAEINLIPMLEDAIRSIVACQMAIFNERSHRLFEYGPACEDALKSHAPEVHGRCSQLESAINRTGKNLGTTTSLISAAKGAIVLLNGARVQGSPEPLNLPQLRMRLPAVAQLILSMVGNETREVSTEDTTLLLVFAEFHQYFMTWREALA